MPFYYYLIAVPLFAVLGVLHHIVRGAFNLYPDRGYTNTPREGYSFTDDYLSDNYSMVDHLVGTEYDDNGYYDLHSLKNVRIACQFSIFGGLAMLVVIPGFDQLFRQGVDLAAVWLWDLFVYRIINLKLF